MRARDGQTVRARGRRTARVDSRGGHGQRASDRGAGAAGARLYGGLAMSLYAETTRVPVSQSRAEIERLLEKHHAKQYGTAVDNERREARVQFRLHDRIVRFVIGLPDPKKFRNEQTLS